MPPAVFTANAQEEYDSLKISFVIVAIECRLRLVLCEDHGGAVFRLAVFKNES
jgi:hypothetical protein